MARLKGAFQADNGDELYPHTSSDVVFCPDGKTVEEQINVLFDTALIDKGFLQDGFDFKNLSSLGGHYVCTLNPDYTYSNSPAFITGNWCRLTVNDKLAEIRIINTPWVYVTGNHIAGDYELLATTSKTDILVTPGTGFEIVSQNCYIMNGDTYINVSIRKTDLTAFGTTHQLSLFTLPITVKNRTALKSTPQKNSSMGSLGNGNTNVTAWTNGYVYAYVDNPNVYGIEITGMITG